MKLLQTNSEKNALHVNVMKKDNKQPIEQKIFHSILEIGKKGNLNSVTKPRPSAAAKGTATKSE